jgi:hypothetical protein
MHVVDLLEEALDLAERMGIQVRRQWLDDTAGGTCRIGNQWVLFANLSLSAEEQLTQVLAALRQNGQAAQHASSTSLKRLLQAEVPQHDSQRAL